MCRLSTADVRTIPVAAFGTHSVFPHQPRDTMLAACLACLSQVEEDAWRTVHALTWVERRADQTKQALVLSSSIRHRLAKPSVVAACRHAQQLAHHLDAVLFAVCLDELVLAANSTGIGFSGHFSPPAIGPPSSKCP